MQSVSATVCRRPNSARSPEAAAAGPLQRPSEMSDGPREAPVFFASPVVPDFRFLGLGFQCFEIQGFGCRVAPDCLSPALASLKPAARYGEGGTLVIASAYTSGELDMPSQEHQSFLASRGEAWMEPCMKLNDEESNF